MCKKFKHCCWIVCRKHSPMSPNSSCSLARNSAAGSTSTSPSPPKPSSNASILCWYETFCSFGQFQVYLTSLICVSKASLICTPLHATAFSLSILHNLTKKLPFWQYASHWSSLNWRGFLLSSEPDESQCCLPAISNLPLAFHFVQRIRFTFISGTSPDKIQWKTR